MKSTQDIIEELKRMECINYSHYSTPTPCTKHARDRLNRLQAALERIRDCDWIITLPDRMDAVRAIAREALE